MKAYRGPKEMNFYSTRHALVDQKKLTECMRPWTEVAQFQVNLNKKKESPCCESVAHILLDPDDVILLHNGLVQGLMERNQELIALRVKLTELQKHIVAIKDAVDRESDNMESSMHRRLTQTIKAAAAAARD